MASESGAASLSSFVPLRLEFRLKHVTFKTNLPHSGVHHAPPVAAGPVTGDRESLSRAVSESELLLAC